MAAPTPNLYLNRPDNGDYLGNWEVPVNENMERIDNVFGPVRSDSSGGTGHIHNSTPGQGPQVMHDDLGNIGGRTHVTLEGEIDGLGTRLTFVETTYCADILCGAGQGSGVGGGGSDPQPPVHYTDNFTTKAKTPLGQNDWLYSSDSLLDHVETTGRSAFLFIDPLFLGTPTMDRYAAVVRSQIPHSTAQRVTFAITRFTADQISDDDAFTMVAALMSTNIIGPSTPFIHYCGMKFVLLLTNNGGVFTVTRQAVAETTDGVFTIVQQDATTGLSPIQAETMVRGIHEFSISEDGGLWYYKDRGPVWIMPPNSVTSFYGPIQQTLLGLGEPPFGSIGFGYAWQIKPLTVIDVEMSWFTMDSKNNVEEPHAPNPFPTNWPRPYDEDPEDVCCDGAGPNVGEVVDVFGDGSVLDEVVAKIGETAFRTNMGYVIQCLAQTVDPYDTPEHEEGKTFTVEIPVEYAIDPDLADISTDPGVTVTDVVVNDARNTYTISGTIDQYMGGTTFDITITAKYDVANTITTPLVTATNAVPVITGIVWTDVESTWVPGPQEGRVLYADVYTNGEDPPLSGPPYPVNPGADLTMTGAGFSILAKWYIGPGHYRLLLDFNDVAGGEVATPSSGTAFSIVVTNRDNVPGQANLKVIPWQPFIHWVTSSAPAWPAPGVYDIDVYGYNFRDNSFATPTLFVMQAPHTVVGIVSYTGTEMVTLTVNIADLGGGSTGNVMLSAYHGSYIQPYKDVQLHPDLVPPAFTGVTMAPNDPQVDGTVTTATFSGTGFPESMYRLQPYYNSLSPVAMPMNRFWDYKIPTPTDASIKMFVGPGTAGQDIIFELDKPGFPTVSVTASPTAIEPTPASDDAWSGGTYPGASGTLSINDPMGSNSYLPGIEIYAEAGGTAIVLGPTQYVDANNLTATYVLPVSLTPGDAINVTITNPGGASHSWSDHDVADLPVNILRVEWRQIGPVEGRSGVPGIVYCKNLDAGATASIPSGATLDSFLVNGQLMEIEVSLPTLSGGSPFTIQINNNTPVASSDSVAVNTLTEADPIVGIDIAPPTPGTARTIRMMGHNLFPPDAYSAGVVPSLTRSANLAWDSVRQTKGEWQGTIDVTGTPGQVMDLTINRPSGRVYSKTAAFTIVPLDLIPSSISAIPSTLASTIFTTIDFSGINFDSVRSVELECEQPTRQPIGQNAKVPCTVVGSRTDLIRAQCTIPTGNVSLTYKALFYNQVLDLLKTEAGLFTVIKSADGPEILNKATLWSIVNTTENATQTLAVSLNEATPINDKNTEIAGTNVVLISVTDISPSGKPGTVFDIEFRNGPAGQEAELAFFNKSVVPEEKDVLRWLIST